MTDLCRSTGKPQLSAAAAQAQVRHSKRTFSARRCTACGHWHVNTPGFINREQARRAAKVRELRTIPIDDEDDTP